MGVFVTHTETASYHAHYELVGIDLLLTVEIRHFTWDAGSLEFPGMDESALPSWECTGVKEDHNKCFGCLAECSLHLHVRCGWLASCTGFVAHIQVQCLVFLWVSYNLNWYLKYMTVQYWWYSPPLSHYSLEEEWLRDEVTDIVEMASLYKKVLKREWVDIWRAGSEDQWWSMTGLFECR